MAWTKDVTTREAAAYRDTFTDGAVGQYTDSSEQYPVLASMRLDGRTFLLDAGCGSGRYLANAAPDQRFVGLDISLEMVKLAREELKRGLFVVGELEHLPFKDAAFDEIICSRVLQHVKDQKRAISELSRTCRNSGDVIVLSLNSWTLHCLYKNIRMGWLGRIINAPFRLLWGERAPFSKWSFDYDNYCSLPELCRLFRRADLAVVEKKGGTIGFPWVFYSFGWARRVQRYVPRLLRMYFTICRHLEDRLGQVFPFQYLLDKIIIKGVKR